jgi:adenosylhomocysteine/aminodeoxyfutalosine nucleosidase
MRIGILGAMQEEITPLLEYFQTYETVQYAGNEYYKVRYKTIELVIAYSKIGKVFASLTASTLIQHFECEKILFTGVAGAINPDLKIGDLVIADKLCQHDVDITAFGHPWGYIPSGKIYYETSSDLVEIAQKAAEESGTKITLGTIATGDQFVTEMNKKQFILDVFKADALEMEGAAVAVVCDAFQIPFLVLRSISDTADHSADVDFDTFLKNASYNSSQLIIKIIDKLERK